MGRLAQLAVVIAAVVALPAVALALSPLVSADWLALHRTDAGLVVIDIRDADDYGTGHIPGSVSTPFDSWAIDRQGLSNELPDVQRLSTLIGGAGITPTTDVVVVGAGETLTDLSAATRVYWTLAYAGHDRIALLDGGIAAWRAADRPLDTAAGTVPGSSFPVRPRSAMLASRDDVAGRLPATALVDGRKSCDGTGGALTIIPGAQPLSPLMLLDDSSRFLSVEQMADVVRAKLGADTHRPVIAYCDSGKTAAIWWFALHEMLGFTDVRIYDGSLEDWLRDKAAPRTSWQPPDGG